MPGKRGKSPSVPLSVRPSVRRRLTTRADSLEIVGPNTYTYRALLGATRRPRCTSLAGCCTSLAGHCTSLAGRVCPRIAGRVYRKPAVRTGSSLVLQTITLVLQVNTAGNGGKPNQTPWPLVRERTIPTELPPLVDEI
jgi:hypothetical protein